MTRQRRTRIALGGYRGRLAGVFQDRAHILTYRRPYRNNCLLVSFMHLWLDDCRSSSGLAIAGRERVSRGNDSEQLQGHF